MQEKLLLNSFNCRGLGDGRKRRAVFQWLKKFFPGIILLQETHSTELCEKNWKQEWGGNIYFSHGTSCARGVAILIPKNMCFTINNMIMDDNGRFILLDIKHDDWEILICNIYAPTKDNEPGQVSLLNAISETLGEFGHKNIIMGGDFNCCLNPLIDKLGGDMESKSKYSQLLEELCEEFNLCDVWRVLNPDLKRFTRRANTKKGIVQSRLDYWLSSVHMIYNLHNTDIKPSIKSDHSILTLSFNIQNTQTRGKGFWKFNASLLRDKEYITRMSACINNCKDKYSDMINKSLKWDCIKCEIRTDTISYASYKAKRQRLFETELNIRINQLEIFINNGQLEYIDEFESLQRDLAEIQIEHSQGTMIRSRAELVDGDEKCSKYFLNLEKRNYNTKYIKTLINDSNQQLSRPDDILLEEEMYYKKLYSKNVNKSDHSINHCDFMKYCKQLSEDDKQLCDQELTVEELGKNLKLLPNNKSPGCDGFTAEFYKFFWKDIKLLLFDSFLYSFDTGILSLDQRRAVLTLIPKSGKDLRYLNNWRPLSILNTDYKILAKSLASRLQSVIGKIINRDQSGYIKGRFIGENIRTVIDILNYTSINDISGFLILIDFEKAFDSISWDFLFSVLNNCNFGENFTKWIRLLYTDSLLCVTNNGYASSFFSNSTWHSPRMPHLRSPFYFSS